MTAQPPTSPDSAESLVAENRLLGELIRHADLSTPVPTCPGWSLLQLFRHVGRGHRWAAQIVAERRSEPLDPRTVSNGKPPEDPDGAIDWFHDSARALLDAVAQVGADTPVWTFVGPRPAAWWIRRRLHEETVHRADAELALGRPVDLSAPLAADGISEWLDILAGRPGPLAEGVRMHLHATDPMLGETGEWTVEGTEDGITWQHGHAKGDVALRGGATALLLALTRRQTAKEAGLEVLGDEAVWTGWLAATPF